MQIASLLISGGSIKPMKSVPSSAIPAYLLTVQTPRTLSTTVVIGVRERPLASQKDRILEISVCCILYSNPAADFRAGKANIQDSPDQQVVSPEDKMTLPTSIDDRVLSLPSAMASAHNIARAA